MAHPWLIPDTITAEGTISWQWYRGSISKPHRGRDRRRRHDPVPPTLPRPGTLAACCGLRPCTTTQRTKTRQPRKCRIGVSDARRRPTSTRCSPTKTSMRRTFRPRRPGKWWRNTRAGTNLGAPVAATDPSDLLTYSLSGTDEESFDITRATGQLMTKAALNHETKETYTVTVTATDPFGATDMSVVTITVTRCERGSDGGGSCLDRPR